MEPGKSTRSHSNPCSLVLSNVYDDPIVRELPIDVLKRLSEELAQVATLVAKGAIKPVVDRIFLFPNANLLSSILRRAEPEARSLYE
jgi:hypothetical protein